MELIGMIASWDFCLFLLGIIGVTVFTWVHKAISRCNPKIFAIICVIIAYFVITYIRQYY